MLLGATWLNGAHAEKRNWSASAPSAGSSGVIGPNQRPKQGADEHPFMHRNSLRQLPKGTQVTRACGCGSRLRSFSEERVLLVGPTGPCTTCLHGFRLIVPRQFFAPHTQF